MISRISRRAVFLTSLIATAVSFFTLGITGARRSDAAAQASFDATIAAIRSEMKNELGKNAAAGVLPAGTAGHLDTAADDDTRAKIIAEVKQELQSEMGLLPVQL